MAPMASHDVPRPAGVPTGPEEVSIDRLRRARLGRRIGVAALVAFVGLAAAEVLGPRTAEVSAAGGGHDLTVTYPAVTRPGLAIEYTILVRRSGGFGGPVTVAVAGDYLALFDENGLDPDPASATATEDLVIWEFDPPPGDSLLVSFDARVEPARQQGASGSTSVLVDGRAVVTVSYRTAVMP